MQGVQDPQLHRVVPRLRAQDAPEDGALAVRLPRRVPQEGALRLPQALLLCRRRRGGLPKEAVGEPLGDRVHGGAAGGHAAHRCPAGQEGPQLRGDLGGARGRAARVREDRLQLPGGGRARRAEHRAAPQGEAAPQEEEGGLREEPGRQVRQGVLGLRGAAPARAGRGRAGRLRVRLRGRSARPALAAPGRLQVPVLPSEGPRQPRGRGRLARPHRARWGPRRRSPVCSG